MSNAPFNPLGHPPSLLPEQLAAMEDARRRWKPLGRGLFYNRLSAWTLAVFAGLSAMGVMLSALMGDLDVMGPLVVLALIAISVSEFKAGARLRALDERAPRHIAINQVLLGVLVAVYCTIKARASLHSNSLSSALGSTADLGGGLDVEELESQISTIAAVAYGAIGGIALLLQALAAWYFASLGKKLRAYIASTPTWLIDAKRKGAV